MARSRPEPVQVVKQRRDAALKALVLGVPFIRFLGVEFDRRGDELTAIMPFDEKLIGTNRMAPSIGLDPNLTSASEMYAAFNDGAYQLPAIPYKEMDQRFRRQRVPNHVRVAPGTILVDTRNHHAYFGLGWDEAVRYGVGVGKAGFEWSGDAVIALKKEWPVWTPPAEMIERRPDLVKYSGGMPGGPQNPLGARSLYLYANGRDTLYRLHGTPEWDSIGKSMSSGCIRFLNHDIIDLYNRAPKGTKVRVV